MFNWIVWNQTVFVIESLLTLKLIVIDRKMYLHLNCMPILNWIVWNGTVFDIEAPLSLNWIV